MEKIREIIRECEKKTEVTFTGEITINGNLKRALGRTTARGRKDFMGNFNVSRVDIEFSKSFIQTATAQELEDVIKHEFAHYVCYVIMGTHNHDTPEFKKVCKLLGTTSNKSMTTENTKYKYEITCSCCNKLLGGYHKSTAKIVEKNGRGYTSKCCNANVIVNQTF